MEKHHQSTAWANLATAFGLALLMAGASSGSPGGFAGPATEASCGGFGFGLPPSPQTCQLEVTIGPSGTIQGSLVPGAGYTGRIDLDLATETGTYARQCSYQAGLPLVGFPTPCTERTTGSFTPGQVARGAGASVLISQPVFFGQVYTQGIGGWSVQAISP